MSFSDLPLPFSLLHALQKEQYTAPYPIQREAIPPIINGKDVLGIAKTGSGKTAAYVLPILAKLEKGQAFTNRQVPVLILVPTRELAVQVALVVEQFATYLKSRVKTLAVHGGVSINPQMQAMNQVQILVATPGRLLDLVDSNAVKLSKVELLVLDEADKMLNLGFKKEMDRIIGLLPTRRQNVLFSATLSEDLASLSAILLQEPLTIKIESAETATELIEQSAYLVAEEKKGPLLRYLIKSADMQQVLVFTSSSYKADNVANKLRKNGLEAAAIHGKKSQSARTKTLKQFKSGKLRVLVTTDLLARGIDIDSLPHVINYELPRSPKDFIHRIGRTGRAEIKGAAISLVTSDQLAHFKVIQKKMKQWTALIDSSEFDLKGY